MLQGHADRQIDLQSLDKAKLDIDLARMLIVDSLIKKARSKSALCKPNELFSIFF